jgi:pimeloyl-ACP methyl ester carboxylesterase
MRNKIVTIIFLLAVGTQLMAQRSAISPKPIGNANGQGVAKPFVHAEGQYQTVNEINIYFEIYGEGDPILLIHDNNGSIEDFSKQINNFAKKNKVIICDSRGQGQSSLTKDSLSYELMADDYFELLEKLELDSVHIVGWGDGGKIGLLMAIKYPQKVNKLVIISTALSSDTTALREEAIAMLNDNMDAARDSIKAGNVAYKDILRLYALKAKSPEIDIELLNNIEAPVFVVCGDNDEVKLSHTIEIYNALPNAQLSIIPAATNNIPSEATIAFNNSVLRFLLKPFFRPQLSNRTAPADTEEE